MTSLPTQHEPEDWVRRRRRAIAVALVATVLTIAWLIVTASSRSAQPHQFFGLWRLRHIVVAFAGIWLSGAALAAAVSRTALWAVLAATFSAAITVLFIEVVGLTGLIDFGRLFHGPTINPYGSERIAHLDVGGITYQDIWTRWGIASPPIPFHFKTDSRGFRNEQDRDSADIYVLGDSFLVAGLLQFEKTATHLLEVGTQRPLMNISLIGLSVQKERDIFRDLNLPLERRLVLHFVFEGNDLLDSAAYREQQMSGGKRERKLSLRDRSCTYQLLMALQRKTEGVDPAYGKQTGFIGDEPYGFVFVGDLVRSHEDEIPYILSALDDARRFVEGHGGVYAVVAIPEKFRVLGPLCRWPAGSDLTDAQRHLSPLLPAVIQWGAEHNVASLDLTSPLQDAARAGRYPWFPGDTHWNENGHEAAANAIAAWIKSQNWQLGAADSR